VRALRLRLFVLASALLALLSASSAVHAFDPVTPGKALEFPRDAGSHPGHRIEWWYVTGHLESARGPLGFQVTFFRVRNPSAEANPSRFSPKQLLFAHAALADPAEGRLLHDQRSARVLEGLVEAKTGDTGVRIDDWSLEREGGAYTARIGGESFSLELTLAPSQPVLLQGEGGFSRKGPSSLHASYYYSEPQLRVSGRVSVKGKAETVRGIAWLDHEWSSELLAADAAGWDWLGANLDDGGALMAFRIRARDGSALWSSATLRPKDGPPETLDATRVAFTTLRAWTSSRTGIAYPVSMDVRVGDRSWRVEPLFDDQELDARASTGTLYWEGAVSLRAADGARARGYLELTGYAGRIPF
jgi:predicted secreted hydrolase